MSEVPSSRILTPRNLLAAGAVSGLVAIPIINQLQKQNTNAVNNQGAGTMLNAAQQAGETPMQEQHVHDQLDSLEYRGKQASLGVPKPIGRAAGGMAGDLFKSLFKSTRSHDVDPNIVRRFNQKQEVIPENLSYKLKRLLEKENSGRIIEEGGVPFIEAPERVIREGVPSHAIDGDKVDFDQLPRHLADRITDPEHPANVEQIGNKHFVTQRKGPQKFQVPEDAIRRTGGDYEVDPQNLPDGLREAIRRGNASIDEEGGLPVVREEYVDPKKVGLTGLGLVGAGALGVGYNTMTTDADNPIQRKIHKNVFGLEDRIDAEEEFLKGLAQGGGRESSRAMVGAIEALTSNALSGASAMPRAVKQHRTFQDAMATDELLQEANPEERAMLGRAYNSMKKFAPELAADEFATKNYLRESLMAASGPDYATISALAKTNRDVTERKGRF